MFLMPALARLIALALALTSASCSGFFYFPSRSRLEPDPTWFPRATLDRRVLHTLDGERLDIWLIQPVTRPLRGTFVQFHGNAGHVGAHLGSLYSPSDRRSTRSHGRPEASSSLRVPGTSAYLAERRRLPCSTGSTGTRHDSGSRAGARMQNRAPAASSPEAQAPRTRLQDSD